jgi:hypothetical protein
VSLSPLLLRKWRRGGACGIFLDRPSNETDIPLPLDEQTNEATRLYFIVNQLSCPRGPVFIPASFPPPSLPLSTVLTTHNYHPVVCLITLGIDTFRLSNQPIKQTFNHNDSNNSSYAKLPFSWVGFGPRLHYICAPLCIMVITITLVKTTFIKLCIKYNGPRLPSFFPLFGLFPGTYLASCVGCPSM